MGEKKEKEEEDTLSGWRILRASGCGPCRVLSEHSSAWPLKRASSLPGPCSLEINYHITRQIPFYSKYFAFSGRKRASPARTIASASLDFLPDPRRDSPSVMRMRCLRSSLTNDEEQLALYEGAKRCSSSSSLLFGAGQFIPTCKHLRMHSRSH